MAQHNPPTGPRKGGRPPGSMNKIAKEARELAMQTGKLPHEILLDIARGYPIRITRTDATGAPMWEREGVPLFDYVVPDVDRVVDAAKAGAPYFAPKISTVEVVQGAPDHELDLIIAQLAAQAGVDLGASGESTPGEDQEADGDSTREPAGNAPRQRRQLNPDF